MDRGALTLLSGQTILVTGSSRGIGWALARGLAQHGARVILNSRNAVEAEAAAVALGEATATPAPASVVFDVTDQDAVIGGIAEAEDRVGPIDVLINNAGVQHREPLTDVSLFDWNRVISTNLTSAFLVGREVAKHMLGRGHGKIVNVASIQAELARPTIAPYTASKGGLRNLTRAMAAEWAGSGVQVNAIAPGYIRTDMTTALVADPEFNRWVIGRTPAARWGETEDLVGPAVFLASELSAFVNGQTIFVDGGMSVVV